MPICSRRRSRDPTRNATPSRTYHGYCKLYTFWKQRVRTLPWSEILLWATHDAPPRALQASECSELLNPTRTSCVILVQRQPGKLVFSCVPSGKVRYNEKTSTLIDSGRREDMSRFRGSHHYKFYIFWK